MSSTDPALANIANILAKVTAFLPEQDAINSEVSQQLISVDQHFVSFDQRLSAYETQFKSLATVVTDLFHLVQQLSSSKNPESHPIPPSKGSSSLSSTDSPAPKDANTKSPATPTWADIVSRPPPPLTDRKRQALHRTFNPNATDSSDAKSYTFVYLPISHPMTRTQIRSKFRAISIDNLRVLDIIFPARHTIGILLHEAYISEFQSKLREIDTSPITSFNPLDPTHICDPKYHDLPQEDRTRLARSLHQDRCLRTLSFIRPNLLPGIAKYFIHHKWIPPHLAQDIINKRIPRPVKRRPISSSSVAQAFEESVPSSDTTPISSSSNLPTPASVPSSTTQTQDMDTDPVFISKPPKPNDSRSLSPASSPRKLRKSSKPRGSKS